jgi:hypothetical protein
MHRELSRQEIVGIILLFAFIILCKVMYELTPVWPGEAVR